MVLTLPRRQRQQEIISVNFFPSKGFYEFYDWKKMVKVQKIEWIIIGEWFQLKWNLFVDKSVKQTYVSNYFGFDVLKNATPINVTLYMKEWWKTVRKQLGSKTYNEWKEQDKFLLKKILFVLNGGKIYKISFGYSVAFDVDNFLKDNEDIPSFHSEIALHYNSEWKPIFDYDEYRNKIYTPLIKKIKPITKDKEKEVEEKIIYIDKIVNGDIEEEHS